MYEAGFPACRCARNARRNDKLAVRSANPVVVSGLLQLEMIEHVSIFTQSTQAHQPITNDDAVDQLRASA